MKNLTAKQNQNDDYVTVYKVRQERLTGLVHEKCDLLLNDGEQQLWVTVCIDSHLEEFCLVIK